MVEQEFMYDLEKVRTNKNSSEYLPDNLADLQLSCDHAAYIRSKNKQSDLEDLHLHVVQFHELFRSKLSRYDKGFRISGTVFSRFEVDYFSLVGTSSFFAGFPFPSFVIT